MRTRRQERRKRRFAADHFSPCLPISLSPCLLSTLHSRCSSLSPRSRADYDDGMTENPYEPTVPPSPVAAPQGVHAGKPATVRYEQFAQLELRVARVLEAREHPNANKLLLLKIKVGDIEKQIVAGIRGHY